jgi:hypothetical protein
MTYLLRCQFFIKTEMNPGGRYDCPLYLYKLHNNYDIHISTVKHLNQDNGYDRKFT